MATTQPGFAIGHVTVVPSNYSDEDGSDESAEDDSPTRAES